MPPEAIRSITRYRPSRVVSSERAREAAVGPKLVVRAVALNPFRCGGGRGAARPAQHCTVEGGSTRAGTAGWCLGRELRGCVPVHRGGRGRGGDRSRPPRIL